MKTRVINFFSIIIFISLIVGCSSKEPIIIGYSGSITGTSSIIGSEVRNGLRLIVDQTNNSGGIDGHQIELLIKDDENNGQTAIRVDRELINEGAKIIVGHITSQLTVEALEAIKNDEVILFSSTASADVLSGQEDNFYRSILSVGQMAGELYQYVIGKGIKKMALVYDTRNQAFADGWIKTFTREMENAGGTITSSISFDSDSENKYKRIATEVGESNTEAVLFIANAFSTALLCRYITEIDPEIMKISSTWAFANFEDLEAYGSDSVEGLISAQPFVLNAKQPGYLNFVDEYNSRFGKNPSPGSVYGYEAGLVLVEALKNAPSLDFTGIQSGLRNVKTEGLHGAIGLDENGDVIRDVFLVQIKNGQLIQVNGE